MSTPMHGLVLTPLSGSGAYTYRPAHPALAHAEDGRAQFSFIRAGSVSMLSFTAVWEAPQAALDLTRAALADQLRCAPAQIDLTPEPLIAGTAELRFGDGAGQWTTAATTTSSGVAPFQAAFSAMLTPEQTDCLLKATAGETGWMGLAYRLTPAQAPVRHSTLDAQATFTAEARLNGTDADQPGAGLHTQASASLSQTDHSTPATPSADESFGDAALWGLPRP